MTKRDTNRPVVDREKFVVTLICSKKNHKKYTACSNPFWVNNFFTTSLHYLTFFFTRYFMIVNYGIFINHHLPLSLSVIHNTFLLLYFSLSPPIAVAQLPVRCPYSAGSHVARHVHSHRSILHTASSLHSCRSIPSFLFHPTLWHSSWSSSGYIGSCGWCALVGNGTSICDNSVSHLCSW